MTDKNKKNPIVETYKGVPIRKYPRVYLRVSVYEMKRFIDAKVDLGISEKEAVMSLDIFCKKTKWNGINKSR